VAERLLNIIVSSSSHKKTIGGSCEQKCHQVNSDGGGVRKCLDIENLRQSLLFLIVHVMLVMILFLLLVFGSCTTSAHTAGIISCSTSSPAANSTDAATSVFYN
jgi:hypothetical protein